MIADTIVNTMAYMVNDLYTATEDSVVSEQRTTLMIALLSGALARAICV